MHAKHTADLVLMGVRYSLDAAAALLHRRQAAFRPLRRPVAKIICFPIPTST